MTEFTVTPPMIRQMATQLISSKVCSVVELNIVNESAKIHVLGGGMRNVDLTIDINLRGMARDVMCGAVRAYYAGTAGASFDKLVDEASINYIAERVNVAHRL